MAKMKCHVIGDVFDMVLNKERHLVQAVGDSGEQSWFDCTGCTLYSPETQARKCNMDCASGHYMIKDLGAYDKNGCLPLFGKYPKEAVCSSIWLEWSMDDSMGIVIAKKTFKGSVRVWNRLVIGLARKEKR